MSMANKTATGVKDLDEMLYGGFITGSANLLEGAPGTGKTTIGMQFIYNGITQFDEPGLIITFEEFPQQYYHDALQLGWDLKKLEEEGKLTVIFSDPETALHEIHNSDGDFTRLIEEQGVKRVLVDSMTYFESLSSDIIKLREIEKTFINALKREGVTSILLRENDSILGSMSTSTSKIPFVVDSYILLRYVELSSVIQKAMVILKMRGSNHTKAITGYQIADSGIEIIKDVFKNVEGIINGSSHQVTPQENYEAFDSLFKSKKGK